MGESILHLIQSNDASLKEVDASSGQYFADSQAFAELFEALKTNSNVTEINLGNNNLADTDVIVLAEALKVNNSIQNEGCIV